MPHDVVEMIVRGDVSRIWMRRAFLLLFSVVGCRSGGPANQLDARTEPGPDAPTGSPDGAVVPPDAPVGPPDAPTMSTLACTVTVLGFPAADAIDTQVTAIDEAGNLAGYYRPIPFEYLRAFRWSAATGYVDLGSLAGIGANANSISGDITVGESKTSPTDSHGFLSDTSGMHELPTLGGTGVDAGRVDGVNASGVAVGSSRLASGAVHAAMYKDGVVTDLGALVGLERSNSWAFAINDRGVIVGTSDASSPHYTAVMWVDGSLVPLGPGVATAVNAAGDAVGGLTLYRGGQTIPIDILPGFERGAATGINDAGVIVGWMLHQPGTEIPSVTHGFIHYNGSTYDLNDLQTGPSGGIGAAVAINNAGQIAANSYSTNGTSRPLIVTCR